MKFFLTFILLTSIFTTAQARKSAQQTSFLEVDQRLQPQSYEMYRKLINIEPDGKPFVLYTLKKGTNVGAVRPCQRTRSLQPADRENMWLYIPNIGKPLRITSLQSVVGGVFNNSDIMQLDYSAEYDAQRLSEDEDYLLLDLQAKNRRVAYDRLKMWVDKPTKYR
ncbi:exported hypothetical protein [uncultured Thiomicrorhabdus sp.]